MYFKKVGIINKTGLHARPAAEFCKIATRFSSDISLKKLNDEAKTGNAKSVLSVMTMCLAQGTELEIIAEGDDEINAVETLTALVEGGFGEV